MGEKEEPHNPTKVVSLNELNVVDLTSDCRKNLIISELLKKHGYIKKNDKSYICCKCERTFTTFSYLGNHMLVHSNERPFACTLCDWRFKYKNNLNDHVLNKHTKRKSFTCLQCKCSIGKKGLVEHVLNCNSQNSVKNENSLPDISSTTIKKHLKLHGSENSLPTCSVKLVRLPETVQPGVTVKINKNETDDSQRNAIIAELLEKHDHGKVGKTSCRCNVCGRTFQTLLRLKDHMLVHSNKRIFKCHLCSLSFRHKNNMKAHILRLHPDAEMPSFTCAKCSRAFVEKQKLIEHVRTCSFDKSDQEVTPHKTINKKNKNKDSSDLTNGITAQNDAPECSDEVIPFLSRAEPLDSRSNPENVHSDASPSSLYDIDALKCLQCGYVFTRKWNLRRHVAMCESTQKATNWKKRSTSYKCTTCTSKFNTKKIFEKHLRRCLKHSDDPKQEELDLDSKESENSDDSSDNNMSNLESESKNNNNLFQKFKMKIKLHAAPTTTESIIKMRKLTEKLIEKYGYTRDANEFYYCGACKTKFRKYSELKPHMLVHTNKKLFKCDSCAMKFRYFSTLKAHVSQVHDTEIPLPFKCIDCKETFKTENVLKKHAKTCKSSEESPSVSHTGKKPFKCHLCKKSYTSKAALNIHIRDHKGEKPFRCKDCGLCFKTSKQLKHHEASEHCENEESSD